MAEDPRAEQTLKEVREKILRESKARYVDEDASAIRFTKHKPLSEQEVERYLRENFGGGA